MPASVWANSVRTSQNKVWLDKIGLVTRATIYWTTYWTINPWTKHTSLVIESDCTQHMVASCSRGLQFCNMRVNFSPVLGGSQDSGGISWTRATRHLRQVTRGLREVDGGNQRRQFFTTGTMQRWYQRRSEEFPQCIPMEDNVRRREDSMDHKQVLMRAELGDTRKLSREKRMGGGHEAP
jgi:hypothetical protein